MTDVAQPDQTSATIKRVRDAVAETRVLIEETERAIEQTRVLIDRMNKGNATLTSVAQALDEIAASQEPGSSLDKRP